VIRRYTDSAEASAIYALNQLIVTRGISESATDLGQSRAVFFEVTCLGNGKQFIHSSHACSWGKMPSEQVASLPRIFAGSQATEAKARLGLRLLK